MSPQIITGFIWIKSTGGESLYCWNTTCNLFTNIFYILFFYHIDFFKQEKPYISFTNVSSNGQVNEAEGFIHQILLYIAYKYQFK